MQNAYTNLPFLIVNYISAQSFQVTVLTVGQSAVTNTTTVADTLSAYSTARVMSAHVTTVTVATGKRADVRVSQS